ncbi:MAG: DinB family protein [Bryobacterales bacterium]|nr:DinB family protein [Bryobacterales bacterium]
MRILPWSLITAVLLGAVSSATAAPMTKLERERLVAHLEMTERWLGLELKGLSEAQLSWRAAEGKWSILEVLDHLTVAEPQYWQWLEEGLKEPPTLVRGQDPDENFLWYGIDRTQRNKTAGAREPKGQLAQAAEGLAKFAKLRSRMLEYARTTQDELRTHAVQKSKTDLYQWLLMISTHSQRHLLQIQEIKASAGYPARQTR